MSEQFPDTVIVDNVSYTINTSYRVVWEWMRLMDNPFLDAGYKFNGTLFLFFNEDPHNPKEAVRAIQAWLLCGQKPRASIERQKAYDFHQDYPWIWAAFDNQYGIDLNADITMHWWKFKARFDELSDKTKIKQIIQIRSMPMPDPKNQEYYFKVLEAKESFSLE